MKTDREICAAATGALIKQQRNHLAACMYDVCISKFERRFNPQKVTQMLDRQEQLESKLKEASEFIQKLGPTIDYDIVREIEEMLGE